MPYYNSLRDPVDNAINDSYYWMSLSSTGTTTNSASTGFSDLRISSAPNFPDSTATRYIVDLPGEAYYDGIITGNSTFVIKNINTSTILTRIPPAGTLTANTFKIFPKTAERRSAMEVHVGTGSNQPNDFLSFYGRFLVSIINAYDYQDKSFYTASTYYTIANIYNTILCDPWACGEMQTIVLPPLVNCQNRLVKIKTVSDGIVKIITQGSDKIQRGTARYLYSQNAYIELMGTTSYFIVTNLRNNYIESGWTDKNRYPFNGFQVVDVTSYNGFLNGERVYESSASTKAYSTSSTATGNSGIYYKNSGFYSFYFYKCFKSYFSSGNTIKGEKSSAVTTIAAISTASTTLCWYTMTDFETHNYSSNIPVYYNDFFQDFKLYTNDLQSTWGYGGVGSSAVKENKSPFGLLQNGSIFVGTSIATTGYYNIILTDDSF
jgi:hypothetical protein